MGSLSAAAAAAAMALAGSMTFPVRGASLSGDETFTGTATARSNGAGTLEMSSSRGLRCIGSFTYVVNQGGKGTIHCSNGENGPFAFVASGMHGRGSGTVGGRGFRFRFGS